MVEYVPNPPVLEVQAGEAAQRVRELAAYPEDLGLFQHHAGWHRTTWNSSSRAPGTLF